MKNPKINNNTSALFGFAHYSLQENGKQKLILRWKKILGTLCVLTLLGWTSLASALFFHFKYRRDFETASYWKMFILPFRLAEHKKELGIYSIEKGLAQLKNGEHVQGFNKLRTGLAKYPNHPEARRIVAEIYLTALDRPDIAFKLLEDGLVYADNDIDYLTFYLRTLVHFERDSQALDLANKLLDNPKTSPEIRQLSALTAANINFINTQYDETKRIISKFQLSELPEAIILDVKSDWELGNKTAAVKRLEELSEEAPINSPYHQTLAQFYASQKEYAKARRLAVKRILANPLNISGQMDLLTLLHIEDKTDELTKTFYSVLESFSNDFNALKALADFAAATGNIKMAETVYERAIENNFSLAHFALIYIDTLIGNKHYNEALELCQELTKENPSWLPENASGFNGLRSLAYYGLGEYSEGKLYLEQCIQDKKVNAQNLTALAHIFEQFGHLNPAYQIIQKAEKESKGSNRILPHIIRIELALGRSKNLTQHLSQYLETRSPSFKLIEQSFNELSSDHFIFDDNRSSLILKLENKIKST